MTRVDKGGLPTWYKSMGDGIVYNEVWDEKAEVKGGKVEESEVEESGIMKFLRKPITRPGYPWAIDDKVNSSNRG